MICYKSNDKEALFMKYYAGLKGSIYNQQDVL